MKKRLAILALVITGVFITGMGGVSADQYEKLRYGVTKHGEVTITDCRESAVGAIVIPDAIDGHPVTKIDIRAFSTCESIRSLTIPNGVKTIGGEAFYWCLRLESITIPDSVTEIDTAAFSDCRNLTEVTIPDSVISMGSHMFFRCEKLERVKLSKNITSIGAMTFYECQNLESITIPEGVTTIGEMAFRGCSKLAKIEVDEKNQSFIAIDGNLYSKDKTTLIQYAIFKDDTVFEVPEGVTAIGDNAFADCEKLKSVIIPSSIKSIGKEAFSGCVNLESVIILPGNTCEIGERAFDGCEKLTRVIMGSGVTAIGELAFDCCKSLKSIEIPGSVEDVGMGAFDGCKSLERVDFKSGIKSIDSYVFAECTKLTEVIIPDSVTRIGDSVFGDCTRLDEMYYTGTKEAWEAIRFGEYNRKLQEVNLHFEHIPLPVKMQAECYIAGGRLGVYIAPGNEKPATVIVGIFYDEDERVINVKKACVATDGGDILFSIADSEEIKKVRIITMDDVASSELINDSVDIEIDME